MTSNLDFLHGLCDSNSAALKEAIGIDQEQRFVEFAAATYLAPLYHELLKNENLESAPILASLENARNQVLVRNMRLYKVFEWFLVEMNKREIPVIPLKGIYVAEKLYGDIGLRHLSDIDLLVKRESVQTVVELMESKNWNIKEAKSHSDLIERELEVAHPFTFFKNGVTIELHTHLYNRKYGTDIAPEELWNHAREEAFLENSIHQFETEFLLQHWCLHLHKHLTGHEVKMLSFWDIRLLLQKNPNFDWDSFKALCEKYNCAKEAFSVLHLSRKYWRAQVPNKCVATDTVLEAKFLDFMSLKPKTATKMAKHRLSVNMKRLSKIDSPVQKLIFLVRYIFPKTEFMRQCYNVSPNSSLLTWYIYRPLELFSKVILALLAKLSR